MDIISRPDAILQQQSRYFTGEPCVRGHIAYRYTKNGGCSDCINPKFQSLDVADRERERLRAAEIRRVNMIPHGFALAPENVEAFTRAVLLFAQMHEPTLQRHHIIAKRGWIYAGNGLGLRQFYIFREDREVLLALEAQMRGPVADTDEPKAIACAHRWSEIPSEPGALKCNLCGFKQDSAEKVEADLEKSARKRK
jgi:hypothetical protein